MARGWVTTQSSRFTEKATAVLGEGRESKSSPHSPCALNDLHPRWLLLTYLQPAFTPLPGCSSLPSCFWPPAVLLPPLCQCSCATEALLAVSVCQLSTHTVDSDFSSTLENKEGDAGQNTSNFCLVSGAQVCLHRQLSCAAAGNGFHTGSA